MMKKGRYHYEKDGDRWFCYHDKTPKYACYGLGKTKKEAKLNYDNDYEDFKGSLEITIIEKYKTLIEKIKHYIVIFDFLNVPEILIKHPELIKSEDLDINDINWAEKQINLKENTKQ